MNGKTILVWIVVMAILIPALVGAFKWRDHRRAKWEATWAAEGTAMGLGWLIDGEARAGIDFPTRMALVGTYRGRTVEVSEHHFGGNSEGDPGNWVTFVDVRLAGGPALDDATRKRLLKPLKRKAYKPPMLTPKTLSVQRKGKHRKPRQLRKLVDEVMDVADAVERPG